MASDTTISKCLAMLFSASLANEPKEQPGEDRRRMLTRITKLYKIMLQDIDDNLLEAAVIQYLSGGTFWPQVGVIRKTALSLVTRADGIPTPHEAWQEVIRAANGSYSVTRVDPVTNELVIVERNSLSPLAKRAIGYLGGLDAFGLSDTSEEQSWRAQFIKAYERLLERQSEDTMMLPAVAGYIQERKELGGASIAGVIADVTDKLKMPTNGHNKPVVVE